MLVLDTETTGLDHRQDKIIELAILCLEVDLASGLPVGAVSVYDGLEDPGRPLSEEVRLITGLSDDKLQGSAWTMPGLPVCWPAPTWCWLTTPLLTGRFARPATPALPPSIGPAP